jgi:ankyrin repeat protein
MPARFLLAMLHVTSLRGKTNVKAIENALAELKTSGSSLIGAYDKTMKMIESQEEGYRRLAKEALSWVAFSSKPLRARQLQHALAIESGKQDLDPANLTELDIIISACAGLITMQRGRGWITVHLVHETTREYLDKTREKWFGNLRPRLARLCLTYLNFETFGSGPCAMNNELVAKLKQYPLYEYLGQTFMEYIEGNEDDVRVKTMLEKFFFSDMHVQTHLQSLSETPWYSAGWTSLHIAVVYRIGIIIPLLIPKWANKQNKNGLTPLHLAVLRRFYEGINSLVSAAQVDCNATTPWKRTALSYACELGDEISIRLLLACNRVDINLADERGRTPISCALEKGLMVAVHLLLERRDVDCVRPDCKGLVPLCYAALSGSEVCIQKLLERSDVNINTKLNNQITILHWAVYKSAMSTFEYILGKSGLNVNIGDHLGRTPLIWCIAHRARKMARLLLSRADVELSTVDNNGQGLLIWGIKYGWPDLLKELLTKLGSQLLVKDKFHLNALDYAAQYGRWHIIEQLLERYRPRICIEHRFAGVALHQAIKNGLPKFTKLLLERTEIESWWAICALLVSMENDTLECFMILREKLHAWMHHHPEWMIACLLRAATTGSDDVLRFMLKVSRGNTSGMQMEQVQLLNDQTWDEIDIRHALIEMPLTQVDIRDRLGQTALHSAARRGDYAASRILLMLGAGRSVRDIAGRTVLERAGKCQGSSWAAKERLEPSLQEPEPRDGG